MLGLGLGVLALVAWDLSREPSRQVSAALMLRGIDLYQVTASPVLGRAGVRCRFEPSCSVYAERVIERHGALIGGFQAARRVARCGPWTPVGTLDPPD
ncbi:MAG: membrane protein insertion efficiency factor YidD [Acidobacteriota bacterium]